MILKAASQASSDVESLTTLTRLTTESEVRKSATDLLEAMGSSTGLEGRFIAIADLETNELVLLTDGDAFNSSRCAE